MSADDKRTPKEIPQKDIDALLAALQPAPEKQQPLKALPSESGEVRDGERLTIDNDFGGRLIYNGHVTMRGRLLPGSRVETSGCLSVAGGITGAVIHAGLGVTTPFIEMSTVVAEDDLLITSHILSSEIICAGGIYCSAGSRITGGICSAYYTVQADVFGDTMGALTDIKLVKSHPRLKKAFDPGTRGDPYIHKIVAMQKVWDGTLLAIREYSYFLRKSLDGPFVLDISMLGGSL